MKEIEPLTDAEQAILQAVMARMQMMAQRLQQAREALGKAEIAAVAADAAGKEALRTVLALRGLNPDGYAYVTDEDGSSRFVSRDASSRTPVTTGNGALKTDSPILDEPQLTHGGAEASG